ncbi:MAG TPA: ClcB-like voltage-gated chloride channel protein, partial [Myxococcota bacterium]|nr:ClcB-like voltage-gated chloride channel protein [Myxococcota bacterium]
MLQYLLTGQTGGLVHAASSLPWDRRLFIPCLGGLGAGLVLYFGGRLARGRSATDFMEAIVLGDGVMPVRPILVRCLSSLLSISSGGSIGREGPMVQLASMLASWVGQLLKVPTPRLRLLVACGVAAGIASAYKAPIAGSLFVAEIVLGSIAMESFGPLVFSAVIATLTSRHFADAVPLYNTNGVPLHSSWEIIPYLFLGLLAGSGGPMFLQLMRGAERLFGRLPGPRYVRLATGGLVVGAMSVYRPEVWGNGYSVVTRLLNETWGWDALGIILLCKLLATAATVGSGAVGGVFTPTLFVGAVLGFLFEKTYHALWPNLTSDPRAYALVGMGCFLTATTHAPLMAIIMLFEMTLDYDIVLPLMLACVTAYYTATSIDESSIYTGALARRGARLPAPVPARRACVADILKQDPVAISETASLKEIATMFARSGHNHLYVVDGEKRLRGAISLMDI